LSLDNKIDLRCYLLTHCIEPCVA